MCSCSCFTVSIGKCEVDMNTTINNNANAFTSYKLVVKGEQNREVKYLYNKVRDITTGKGVPVVFNMGADIITISPEMKSVAKTLKKDLKKQGIVLDGEKKNNNLSEMWGNTKSAFGRLLGRAN